MPRPRTVALLAACWALPLLPTGPMGSLDVTSYAAVGRLAAIGLDPYAFGPAVLSGSYAAAVSPTWLWTPTPYGPVQIAVLHGVADLAGTHLGLAVLLIRLVAVAALAAAAALAVRAAASDERTAVLVLVALNPLLLVHVVSGAHLDVIVGALAVLVVLLVRADHHLAAMVAAVVACQVKMPGAVLVAYVALDVVRRTPRVARGGRLAATLGVGGLSAAVTWLAFPNAFGWLGSLGVPGAIRSGIAPSTWAGYAVAAVTGGFDERNLTTAMTTGRVLVALAGAALVCRLLWRAAGGDARQAFAGVGWALIALSFAGPVTYPWYVTWGLFAAVVGSGMRGRVVLLALSTALALTGGAAGGAAGVVAAVAGVAVTAAVLWRARGVLAGAPVDEPTAVPDLPTTIGPTPATNPTTGAVTVTATRTARTSPASRTTAPAPVSPASPEGAPALPSLATPAGPASGARGWGTH